MLPMSIQCDTCGEYMYRGKKFNSRKEDVLEEDYHGIRIFRFYIKCTACSAEITFKTDPKSGDYVTEKGCQRNFEPWREKQDEVEQKLVQKQLEEKGDSMKTLENRTLDSKREMDILDALDEIRAINQRHERVDPAAVFRAQDQTQAQARAATASVAAQELLQDQEQTQAVFAQNKKRCVEQHTRPSPARVVVQKKKKGKTTTQAGLAPVVVRIQKKTEATVTSLVAGYSTHSSSEEDEVAS